ncbi:MAG: prephenate dehydrogenase/arogenate dehydrogenase family protein [Candidatus Methanomethylicia archaeon]
MNILNRNILIIGGAGKMGLWFSRFFLNCGFNVSIYDIDVKAARNAQRKLNLRIYENIGKAIEDNNLIVISVPMEALKDVFTSISHHIHNNHIIIDISSVKVYSVKLMHEYVKQGFKIGVHPMFGPGARTISGKTIIFTPINIDDFEPSWSIAKIFVDKGAKAVFMTPEEHDKYISVILTFPFVISISVMDVINNLNFDDVVINEISSPSFKLLHTLCKAIIGNDPKLYTSIIKYSSKDAIKYFSKILNDIANMDELSLKDYAVKLKSRLNFTDLLEAYNLMYDFSELKQQSYRH